MSKPALLYDLGTLVREKLEDEAAGMAEAVQRTEEEILPIVRRHAAAYGTGDITQGEYWSDIAGELLLEDLDVPAVYAERSAQVHRELMGYVRAQSGAFVLGLVSDATPDWVGLWRKQLTLDKLFDAHIIDSDLDRRHRYPELLRLGAERLQRRPEEVTFVDHRPRHLEAARQLGMTTIDSAEEFRARFAALS